MTGRRLQRFGARGSEIIRIEEVTVLLPIGAHKGDLSLQHRIHLTPNGVRQRRYIMRAV